MFLWEYQIKKPKGENHSDKTYLNLIYEGPLTNSGITETIDLFSTWNETDYYKELPIFEVKTQQDFPMDQTLVPIMKRKVMAYNFQVVVGCFSIEENAQKLVKELKSQQLDGYISGLNKKGLHVVSCGKFNNKEKANSMLSTIRANYPNAWIMSK